MRRSQCVLAAAAGLWLAAAGCGVSEYRVAEATTQLKQPHERQPAPDFELKDADGRTVRLSDYRGKVVLLNFWATWCGPCKLEIPWFVEFEKELKDEGFAVLGISMDEGGWDAVKPYLESVRVNYRVLMGNEEVAVAYGGVESLPTTFLIDREGRIARVHVGLVSKAEYENDIKTLLGQESGARRDRPGVLAAGGHGATERPQG